jgi:hypothetical protein
MVDSLSKAVHVHCGCHLAENVGPAPAQLDLRPEARWYHRLRRRANHDRRQGRQPICLNHHRESPTVLNSASTAGQVNRVDVATQHSGSPSPQRSLAPPSHRQDLLKAAAPRLPGRSAGSRASRPLRSPVARPRPCSLPASGRDSQAHECPRGQVAATEVAGSYPRSSM